MKLNLKTFGQLVEDMSAALQGSATSLVDVSVGSVVRAIFEANASVVLWLQWIILRTLGMTRAATSAGGDLDSWMADFGLIRLAAAPATGTVTFSRFAADRSALLPVGSLVKTADGLQGYTVIRNELLSTWQEDSRGYMIPAGVISIDVPVGCISPGVGGNVLAGTITTIAASLPGIDQVINSTGFVNGIDAEQDLALRTRFQTFLSSRSRATVAAIQGAIANVQQNLIFLIIENTNADGTRRAGSFLVLVDDGSGYPSSDLLSTVYGAIDLVRPVGTSFAVLAPPVITVDVSLTAIVDSGGPSDAYSSSIVQLITSYLNSLSIGETASLTRVAMNGYAASAFIRNVTSLSMNGAATDLTPPPRTVIKAGVVSVVVHAR